MPFLAAGDTRLLRESRDEIQMTATVMTERIVRTELNSSWILNALWFRTDLCRPICLCPFLNQALER